MSEVEIRKDFIVENFEGYIRFNIRDNKGSCIKMIVLNKDQVKTLQEYLQGEINNGNLYE